ncbi:MAG: DUF2752 domain-containing protein [Planctomycetes bacterium]|nr:DUF2752 domain-containing protein [Planctomycetota bacterium]
MKLPPCDFLASTDLPCPFCGGTTSFCLFIQGRVLKAFRAHPVAPAFTLLVLACPLWALRALFLHQPFFPSWARAQWPWLILSLGLLCAATWSYRILFLGD